MRTKPPADVPDDDTVAPVLMTPRRVASELMRILADLATISARVRCVAAYVNWPPIEKDANDLDAVAGSLGVIRGMIHSGRLVLTAGRDEAAGRGARPLLDAIEAVQRCDPPPDAPPEPPAAKPKRSRGKRADARTKEPPADGDTAAKPDVFDDGFRYIGNAEHRQRTIDELPESLRGLMDDPNVNDHGVYELEEEIPIVMPKSWKLSATVRVAIGNDRGWRWSACVSMPKGGSTCPIMVHDTPLPSRKEAILAACDSIAARFAKADLPKAARTVDAFRLAQEQLSDEPAPIVPLEELLEAESDADAEASAERTCRECGCTDLDCRGCIERTGEPCHWVEYDLCSACVPDLEPAPEPKRKRGPRRKADGEPSVVGNHRHGGDLAGMFAGKAVPEAWRARPIADLDLDLDDRTKHALHEHWKLTTAGDAAEWVKTNAPSAEIRRALEAALDKLRADAPPPLPPVVAATIHAANVAEEAAERTARIAAAGDWRAISLEDLDLPRIVKTVLGRGAIETAGQVADWLDEEEGVERTLARLKDPKANLEHTIEHIRRALAAVRPAAENGPETPQDGPTVPPAQVPGGAAEAPEAAREAAAGDVWIVCNGKGAAIYGVRALDEKTAREWVVGQHPKGFRFKLEPLAGRAILRPGFVVYNRVPAPEPEPPPPPVPPKVKRGLNRLDREFEERTGDDRQVWQAMELTVAARLVLEQKGRIKTVRQLAAYLETNGGLLTIDKMTPALDAEITAAYAAYRAGQAAAAAAPKTKRAAKGKAAKGKARGARA